MEHSVCFPSVRRKGKAIGTRAPETAQLSARRAACPSRASCFPWAWQHPSRGSSLGSLWRVTANTAQVRQLLHPGTGRRLDAKVLNFFFLPLKKVNIYRYNWETPTKLKKKKKGRQLTDSILIKVRCCALPSVHCWSLGTLPRSWGSAGSGCSLYTWRGAQHLLLRLGTASQSHRAQPCTT